MADSSPLAGLLDQADHVFSLAGKLGRAFHEEHRQRREQIVAARWEQHAETFKDFCASVLGLRDAIQNPPDGFTPVVKPLLEAARIAKEIRDTIQKPGGPYWSACLDFFPELNSVAESGSRAVQQALNAIKPDDPFAFVDKPAENEKAMLGMTDLEHFPATTSGHLNFIESVRDALHHAAEAKRNQFAKSYSNATVECTIRAVKWNEARSRIAVLSGLPHEALEPVARVLDRELTLATVEQLDELLTPLVFALRDAFERSNERTNLSAALDSAVSEETARKKRRDTAVSD